MSWFEGCMTRDPETGHSYEYYQGYVLKIYPDAWAKYGWTRLGPTGIIEYLWKIKIVLMPKHYFYIDPINHYPLEGSIDTIGDYAWSEKVAWKSAYLQLKTLESI
jgi:hypothetical protein